MNMAQMLVHCSAAIGMAEGNVTPPRILLGRLLGPLAKKSLIVKWRADAPKCNDREEHACDGRTDFMVERQRLRESIDHFASRGPAICTKHPPLFFGPLTPGEWAVLMYQHLDHHLRQFGV